VNVSCFIIFCFSFCICLSLSARIGEKRGTLESRLLKSNGIVLRSDEINESRQTGMLYLDYEEYFPKPYEIRIYYKSSDGTRPKPNEIGGSKLYQVFDRRPPPKKPISSRDNDEKRLEGWELHVVYVEGISTLEVYKKNSAITEHEIKYLLNLQSGNSFWVETTEEDLPEGKFSALGFNLARIDGHLRAKKLSSRAIMIFRSRTDDFFYQSKMKEDEEKAPYSIKGF